MQDILVELLRTVRILHIHGDLLVGEEHEMLDENLGCFLQSIRRVN